MKMWWKRALFIWVLLGIWHPGIARAGDLKITIPRRSQPTPVQRLNREGVQAIRKHQYGRAKALFYKAYLFDPGDPFTLNNLGYISELDGELERAQTFYALASALPSDAAVDQASASALRGTTFQSAIRNAGDVAMRINRANSEAVRLLSQSRGAEAERLLQGTLALDPRNGFTLNNLGVAKESEGNFDEALRFYTAAANSRSADSIILTSNNSWRGSSVRDLATASAKSLRERTTSLRIAQARATLLNAQGVSAINHNDLRDAATKFSQAYELAPNDAFSLNNQGYLAEMDGDLETAQKFYRDAQKAAGAHARVGVASRPKAEGMALVSVADQSENQVAGAIETANAANRRRTGPIQLKHRDNTPVLDPPTPLGPVSPSQH